MTKNVRIENADNANYEVVVEVWEILSNSEDGTTVTNLVQTYELPNPTDMFTTYLTSTRYLIIKEK